MEYAKFFSARKIIEALCRYRTIRAKARHDHDFENRIVDVDPEIGPERIDQLFPPRKLWLRSRKNGDQDSPLKRKVRSLCKTVMTLRNDHRYQTDSLLIALREFIEIVRSRALATTGHELRYNQIELRRKPGRENFYRPIVKFNLEERVIDSLVARYLRHCFDSDFLDCSYAFRTVYEERSSPPNHHDAFRAIVNYHDVRECSEKWAAECDVKAFYDCVDHSIAIEYFNRAIERAAQRGIIVDPRASSFFHAYLNGYTFYQDVKISKLTAFRLENTKNECADCKWPVNELIDLHADYKSARIGVPQGGALSCLIVNLILDFADRSVIGEQSDPDLFYARYCDDMIIIHKNSNLCSAALDRYLASLRTLKLPVHSPQSFQKYGAEFWESKSKRPFCWTSDKAKRDGVPWISFVGYQLHYNMTIRMRISSVKEEMQKQNKLAMRILFLLRNARARNRPIKISAEGIFNRVQQKLISMSVGRRTLRSTEGNRNDLCWASGFDLLDQYQYSYYQLKWLDRSRGRVLARLNKRLRLMNISAPTITRAAQSPGEYRALRYYGFPYSYASQFRRPHRP